MSKLVQNSPTSGSTTSTPAAAEQPVDAAVDDEQLLVLDAAQAVEDRHHAGAGHLDARRHLVEQPGHEQLGELVRGGHVGLVDAGLAVDAQPDRHPPLAAR